MELQIALGILAFVVVVIVIWGLVISRRVASLKEANLRQASVIAGLFNWAVTQRSNKPLLPGDAKKFFDQVAIMRNVLSEEEIEEILDEEMK